MKSTGEPYEGEPHVRFDEGEQGRPSGCPGYGRLRHSPGNGEPTSWPLTYGCWEIAEPVPYSTTCQDAVSRIDGLLVNGGRQLSLDWRRCDQVKPVPPETSIPKDTPAQYRRCWVGTMFALYRARVVFSKGGAITPGTDGGQLTDL